MPGKEPSAFGPETDKNLIRRLLRLRRLLPLAADNAYPVVEKVLAAAVELPEGIGPQGVITRFQIVRELDVSGETVSGAFDFYPDNGIPQGVQNLGVKEIARLQERIRGSVPDPALEPDGFAGRIAAAVVVKIDLLRRTPG